MQDVAVPMITMLYAGILGLFSLVLAGMVVRQRLRNKVGTGDGGVPALDGAIRAHGNFIEYVPLALLLILLLELAAQAPLKLHLFGAALVIGRVLHAFGLSTRPGKTSVGRFWGTIVTWLVVLLASLNLIFWSVSKLLAG